MFTSSEHGSAVQQIGGEKVEGSDLDARLGLASYSLLWHVSCRG